MPTIYEQSVDMTNVDSITVRLKSDSYGTSDLYRVVRYPKWLFVDPSSGIVGDRGMSLLLRVDKDFLERNTQNVGQVILQTSGGYTIVNVTKTTSNAGAVIVNILLTTLLIMLVVGLLQNLYYY